MPRHSSKVSSEDKLSVVILMYRGHGRAHGARVPRVPGGGYAPEYRYLAITIEPSMCGGDAACCLITLTDHLFLLLGRIAVLRT